MGMTPALNMSGNMNRLLRKLAERPLWSPREVLPTWTTLDVKIANAYEAMGHCPTSSRVIKAYHAFRLETWQQYDTLIREGYQFFALSVDSYVGADDMVEDVDEGKLNVFTGGEMPADHPLSAACPGVLYNHNLVFRAVHDIFGHAMEGYAFDHEGEDNAWRVHASMYSPLARLAMTTETRGQDCWVNYGPHGGWNRTPGNIIRFAPQKAGVLPGFAFGGM